MASTPRKYIPGGAADAVEKSAVTFSRMTLVFVRQVQRHKHLPYWQRERRAAGKINSSTQTKSTSTERVLCDGARPRSVNAAAARLHFVN